MDNAQKPLPHCFLQSPFRIEGLDVIDKTYLICCAIVSDLMFTKQ